jgi:hypothetical protein
MTVSQRFEKFLENIQLTFAQGEDGAIKHSGVRRCLNSHYYNSSSETANSFLIGSWARKTRVRPPRDIDLMFTLPKSVYDRHQGKSGNKQSQLLQEVKGVLAGCYTSTDMSGDGQVVIIPFATQAVEVVPCFLTTAGNYLICDTNNGGSWKTVDPGAQAASLQTSDTAYNGNTRHLIRMLKKWQFNCSVPLKSFWLELLAEEFISSWEHRGKSYVYYDWMVRDFFIYLIAKSNGWLTLPSTYEMISLGDSWKSRGETARDRAIKGCEYEAANQNFDAWWEWKNIFGEDVPQN